MYTLLVSTSSCGRLPAVGRGGGRADARPDPTPHRRRGCARGRRPPRSSATPASGLCRPPRCWRQANGRRSGYRAAPITSRATPNVGDFAGTLAVGSRTAPRSSARSWSTRGSTATCGRCSSTTRRRRHRRSLSAGQPALDRRQRRRPVCRRESQPAVGVPAASGGVGRARHRQAADRQDRTSASAPAKPTRRRLHRQQGNREGVEVSGYAGLSRSAASPDGFDMPTRRVPVGRRRRRFRRAARCGSRRIERPVPSSDTATMTARRWSAVDGSVVAADLEHREA